MKGEISQEIRELREERGLSLGELAEKTGISKTLLAQIEEGKMVPSVATLIHLSQVFQVPLKSLAGLERGEE
jgi:transcriptional regulator with XRE-family HTH domain